MRAKAEYARAENRGVRERPERPTHRSTAYLTRYLVESGALHASHPSFKPAYLGGLWPVACMYAPPDARSQNACLPLIVLTLHRADTAHAGLINGCTASSLQDRGKRGGGVRFAGAL